MRRTASTRSTWRPLGFANAKEATGISRSLQGPQWWSLEDGTSLAALAARLSGTNTPGRDWSDLHTLLALVPEGRWTSYGDLADQIGTAAQPLGQHLTSCVECENAHRVLNASGKVADGFRWTDPDATHTAEELLAGENITFDNGGSADAKQRLSAAELAELVAR